MLLLQSVACCLVNLDILENKCSLLLIYIFFYHLKCDLIIIILLHHRFISGCCLCSTSQSLCVYNVCIKDGYRHIAYSNGLLNGQSHY